ncbi:MAG: hypothetical protein FJZ11_02655 [Candidatus Omnitrophica bacterium]|nr:hypothetical protein [Candidatus Omnitrophota bacterium]MBM3251669.1 hypothetical protein [Candidatus Omnitrophota bacterium]
MKKSTLDKVYLKTIDLLNKEKLTYLIIGGLATGVIGEARLTQDIDVLISIPQYKIKDFFSKAKKIGFSYSPKQVEEDIKLRGVFKLMLGDFHVDFIIAGMPFEQSAFSRKKKISLYNRVAYFPSPEDLILFKIIASRPKDILDIKAIVLRHRKRLDVTYLKKWARIISNDLQNVKIYTLLERLLKE